MMMEPKHDSLWEEEEQKGGYIFAEDGGKQFFLFFSFWAAAPKGSMTHGFTHMGNFLLLLLLLPLRPFVPPLTQIQPQLNKSR